MAKKVLKINYDDEMDFLLFGISSGFKDYRLCFELNRALDINLERIGEHTLLIGKNNSQLKYERFRFINEYEQCFTLIANRNEKHLLLPELNMIDFLLMIDPAEGINKEEFMQNIKNIELVNAVFLFNPKEIKSRQNLLS
ncbi:MAG: IPExxxVDY family protein [Bacteroidia bacterium]